MAAWDSLPWDMRLRVFRNTLRDEAALAERLRPF
jgi:hypothetical protein